MFVKLKGTETSITQEESGEVIQRKIDRLEATLLEKIRSLQQQIQELAPNPN